MPHCLGRSRPDLLQAADADISPPKWQFTCGLPTNLRPKVPQNLRIADEHIHISIIRGPSADFLGPLGNPLVLGKGKISHQSYCSQFSFQGAHDTVDKNTDQPRVLTPRIRTKQTLITGLQVTAGTTSTHVLNPNTSVFQALALVK